MNKKAITYRTIVLLAILLVGAILFFTYLMTSEKKITEDTKLEACRTSIITISKATEVTKGALPFLKLNCPASNNEITDPPNVAVMKIATELSNCWYASAEEHNRLGLKYSLFIDWLDEDEDICLVCSTFSVDKRIPVSDIKNYLDEKNIKVTSWDNDHIFIEPKPGIEGCFHGTGESGEVRPASNGCWLELYFAGRKIESKLQEKAYLEPGVNYYIMSINSAHSRTDEFNMVTVVAAEDLDEIKCDGDTIFYQQS